MAFVTPELVCRRFYSPRSITHVQTRLKELCDSGVLVKRGWAPGLGGGSRPYVYSLAPKTRSQLVKSGYLPNVRYRPGEDRATKQYPAHTLAVNEVLVSAELVPTFDHFVHERTVQRMNIPYKPDAYIQFVGSAKPYGLVLEVDLDTEDRGFWEGKIKRMVEFINSDTYDTVFPHFDGVLVVGKDELRTNRLQMWTAHTLTRLNIEAGSLFHYATLEACRSPEVVTPLL